MNKASALIFVLAASAAGCNTSIDIADYNRACAVATDCEIVHVGEICGCACQYAAIAKSDVQTYMTDYSAANENCSGDVTCFAPCEPPGPAACAAGQCSVGP